MATSTLVKAHYEAIVNGWSPSLGNFSPEVFDSVFQSSDSGLKERLATILKGADKNFMIQKVAEQIEEIASRYGTMPEHIYVGKYPTGSFNAQVMKTTDGPLVLINTGAEFLIIEIVKLFVAGTFAFVDSASTATERDVHNAISMNESEVAEQLARLLYAYVAHGSASAGRKLPPMQGESLIATSKLAWAAQEFLVAHEYGHILKGHLNGTEPKNAVTNGGKLEVNWKRIEQDVEADAVALQICNALTFAELGPNIDSAAKLIQLQIRFAGPTIFFVICDLLEEAFKGLVGKRGHLIIGDHPPSPYRLKYCNDYLGKVAGEKPLEMAGVFQRWIEHYRDSVIDLTRRLIMA